MHIGFMGEPIYRGVHAKHPALADARKGIARPGNVSGSVTAQMHNLGGYSHNSPYTSWTRSRDVAMTHARKQGVSGGVILETVTGGPPSGAQWTWEHSPDVWCEQEVLLRGTRSGLGVTIL
jgi:hypothetical protein